jgi:hypothetical protein
MNKILIILIIIFFAGCEDSVKSNKRVPVARVGDAILYYDQIPSPFQSSADEPDSKGLVQNYINKWAKRELLLKKAAENLLPEIKNEIEGQIDETRKNLFIHHYQRQMILEKMDTLITENEMETYYISNENSFPLSSNIVKVLFIKLPVETPDLFKIRSLARSDKQSDLQELERICYQFAEKFDDFNEKWITMDKLSLELHHDFENQDNFLKWNNYFEKTDAGSTYLVSIRDYRLRSSIAPYDYVREDIKRIIWNNRRIVFIQALENGIYNEALRENSFKIY